MGSGQAIEGKLPPDSKEKAQKRKRRTEGVAKKAKVLNQYSYVLIDTGKCLSQVTI